jgi:hypothetical protein
MYHLSHPAPAPRPVTNQYDDLDLGRAASVGASGEGDAGQAAWGRMTLCRITLSARKSTRDSSSTVSGSASRSTTV